MKKVFLLFLLIAAGLNLSAQDSKTSKDPKGKWNFEAPMAPQGYTSGVVEVTSIDNKLSATMTFTGIDFKFPGDTVRFENDTLKITLYVEGTDVNIKIKFEGSDKMSGVAKTPDSEIPIVLTREKSK